MSTLIWCEIVCATCSDTVAGQYTSGAIPRRTMKAEARKQGFVFELNEAFCSKTCLERWRNEEPRP